MEDTGRVVERSFQCRYWLPNLRRPEGLHRRALDRVLTEISPRLSPPLHVAAEEIEHQAETLAARGKLGHLHKSVRHIVHDVQFVLDSRAIHRLGDRPRFSDDPIRAAGDNESWGHRAGLDRANRTDA